jgi:nucleoside 2-deoxyribosyltransferase
VKVIYIAGKYRGPNAWAIEQNIRAAEDVAARVWAAGHVALCPHANSRHMDGVASDEVFLAGTLELMRRCDAVVLVPNWRDSEGARAEVAEAERLGLPVFGREAHGYIDGVIFAMDRWARGATQEAACR